MKEYALPKEWPLTADTLSRLTNPAELNRFAEELLDPEHGADRWRTDPVHRARALESYGMSTGIMLQKGRSDAERASLTSFYQRCFAYHPFFLVASNSSTEQEIVSYREKLAARCSAVRGDENHRRCSSLPTNKEAVWLDTDEDLWLFHAYHLSIRPRLGIEVGGAAYTPDLYLWMPANPCFRIAIEYEVAKGETPKWRHLCEAGIQLLSFKRLKPLSEAADALYAALVLMRFSDSHPFADLEEVLCACSDLGDIL